MPTPPRRAYVLVLTLTLAFVACGDDHDRGRGDSGADSGDAISDVLGDATTDTSDATIDAPEATSTPDGVDTAEDIVDTADDSADDITDARDTADSADTVDDAGDSADTADDSAADIADTADTADDSDVASNSGESPAELRIDKLSAAFGSVVSGDVSPPVTFVVVNAGGTATGPIGTGIGGDDPTEFDIASDTCGPSLAPRQACTLTVSFAPATAGARAARLEVGADPGGSASAALEGDGLAPGALELHASASDLGTALVGVSGVTLATFTVTNGGGSEAGPLAVQAGGNDPTDFKRSEDHCQGAMLAAGASCTFEVALAPGSRGPKSALFEIGAHPGGTVRAAVNGVGLAPAHLVAAPGHRSLGSVAVGDTSSAGEVVVTNSGDAVAGPLASSLAGTNAASFARAGCAAVALAGGQSCVVAVTFTPVAPGPSSARLELSASPGGSATTTVEGVGVVSQLAVAPTFAQLPATRTGEASATRRFTVTNASAHASGRITIALGGLAPEAFELVADDCDGATLAADASCALDVIFAPASSGDATAELIVTSPASGVATAALAGFGVAPAALEIAPPAKGFGAVAVGAETAAQTFTVTNVGGEGTGTLDVALAGADADQFVLAANGCPAQLQPLSSCGVLVRFQPGAIGTATAALVVSAVAGGQASSALSGAGVDPRQLLIGPPTFEFMPTALGDRAIRTFAIENGSDAATGPIDVTVTGTGASDFTLEHECAALDAHDTCLATITFEPQTTGLVTASLAVVATPGGSAASALSGVGLARIALMDPNGPSGAPVTTAEFGDVLLGASSAFERAIDVRNQTAAEHPLTIAPQFGTPPQFELVSNSCVATGTIAGNGGLCAVRVRFRPTIGGDHAASVTFSIGAGAADSATWDLHGHGVAPPAHAPTGVALAPSSVAENQPAGTTVGSLSASDDDPGDTFTFSLVTGAGSTDNGAFAVVAATLVTAVGLDHEADATRQIRVRVTDASGKTFEQALSVTVSDVDEPASAAADEATVAEDAASTVIDVLANDADPDDALAIAAATDPAHGTVVAAAQSLRYAPDHDYCNTSPGSAKDTFAYTLVGGATATVTVTVTCVDDAPVAVNDAKTIVEDAAASAIDVLANDTDGDGGPKTIASVTQPANGTVALTGPAGARSGLTYQPHADYCNGGAPLDTFKYTLNGGAQGTVSVTVGCEDDAPLAVNDVATLAEGSAATAIGVLANDTDGDGGPLTIAAVTQPSHGTVAITDGGAGLTYAPTPGYCNDPPASALDAFTYTLDGGAQGSVTVTVSCVDDAPVAVNDAKTVGEDAAPTAIDVLANDTDGDAGPKTIASAAQPSHGTVVLTGPADARTGLTYEPADDYCNDPPGTTLDTFKYTLNGGSQGTVSVKVTCVNDAPVAVADAFTAEEGNPGAFQVRDNDTDVEDDAISITAVSDPAHGTASIDTYAAPVGQVIVYNPDEGYCNDPPGTSKDTFTYTINGGAQATVSMTVTCVDDPPVAVNDAKTLAEDAAATAIDVLANDTDVDAGPKTIASAAQPSHGTVVLTGPADARTGLTYEPADDYCNDPPGTALDTFKYTLNGGSQGTVSVKVTCVNDAPVAVADAFTASEGNPGAFQVRDNDTDAEGDAITITSMSDPAHGTVGLDTYASPVGQVIVYNPDEGYCNDPPGTSTDTFTYTINGGAQATVSMTVTCVDDPPVAVNDAKTLAEDAAATAIDVLANDTDVDGGDKTIASVTQPAGGTVALTGPADARTGLTYEPADDYCNDPPGTSLDTFKYTLNGGMQATVSVKVTCAADAPVAVADAFTAYEDSPGQFSVRDNDNDPEGDAITITSFSDPPHGSLALADYPGTYGQVILYYPDEEYCNDPPGSEVDTFTYTVNGGSVATVSMTVLCEDDPPDATNDPTIVVGEDAPATAIDVLANDVDVDGPPLSIASVAQPAHGAVVITGPDGQGTGLTYAPASDYCNSPPGTARDTFTYTLNGDVFGIGQATVSVAVTCVNNPPVAQDDSGTAAEDGFVSVFVIDNDADPEGDAVSLVSTTLAQHGLVFLDDGTTPEHIVYVPDDDYCNDPPGTEPDTFTYMINGGAEATVSMKVTCDDDAAVAVDDAKTAPEDAAPTAIDVLLNDTDVDGPPPTIASVIQPAHGAVVLTGPVGARTGLTYEPVDDYCNSPPGTTLDTFSYTLTGGDQATVSVTVVCTTDEAVAFDDSKTLLEDVVAPVAIDVLANDVDIDGPAITIGSAAQGQHGTVALTGPVGARTGLTYQPASNYCGADGFSYTLYNGSAANVAVTITCVNDPPSFTVGANQVLKPNRGPDGGSITYTIDPWSSALGKGPADESGQTLGFVVTSNSNAGIFDVAPAVSPTGVLTYTTKAGTAGTATIGLKLVDSGGIANGGADTSATTTFTIQTINNPVAIDDAYDVNCNVWINLATADIAEGVLQRGTNDFAAGASLNLYGPTPATVTTAVGGGTLITTINGGSVVLRTNGTFFYNPAPGFVGNDEFYYNLHFGLADDVGKVTLTVSPQCIWFFSASATDPADGRITNPFKALASFVNDGAANHGKDFQVLHLAAGSYDGGLALRLGQKVIGAGAAASIEAITSITLPPFSSALPATGGTRPTLTTTAAGTNAITLGGANIVRGLDIGNRTGIAIAGSGFGTLWVQELAITGSGQALSLSTGTLRGAIDATSCSGAATCISLSQVNSYDSQTSLGTSGALSATGTAFSVSGVSFGGFTYGGDISSSGATAVSLNGFTSVNSAFALTGRINPSGTGGGITVTNSNAFVQFGGTVKKVKSVALSGGSAGAVLFNNGGLAVAATGGGTSFSANNAGTLIVSGSGNTVTATSGTAVSIRNTTIGSQHVTFQSVSAGTAAATDFTGIVLDGTGDDGSFKVTGVGSAAGSGGVIQNKRLSATSTGISLHDTLLPSFTLMQLNDFSGNAISADGVRGITLQKVVINGEMRVPSGTGQLQSNGGAISFKNDSGVHTLTDLQVSGGLVYDLLVTHDSATPVTASYAISGTTFSALSRDGSSLVMLKTTAAAATTSNAHWSFTDCAFYSFHTDSAVFVPNVGNGIETSFDGPFQHTVEVRESAFDTLLYGLELRQGINANVDYVIRGNDLLRSDRSAIWFTCIDQPGDSGLSERCRHSFTTSIVTALVQENSIGVMDGPGGANYSGARSWGIQIEGGDADEFRATLHGNVIAHTGLGGIDVQSGVSGNAMSLRVTDNEVVDLDGTHENGIEFTVGKAIAEAGSDLTLDCQGNASSNVDGYDIVATRTNGSFGLLHLSGFAGSFIAFLQSLNPGNTVSTSGSFINAASIDVPDPEP